MVLYIILACGLAVTSGGWALYWLRYKSQQERLRDLEKRARSWDRTEVMRRMAHEDATKLRELRKPLAVGMEMSRKANEVAAELRKLRKPLNTDRLDAIDSMGDATRYFTEKPAAPPESLDEPIDEWDGPLYRED